MATAEKGMQIRVAILAGLLAMGALNVAYTFSTLTAYMRGSMV